MSLCLVLHGQMDSKPRGIKASVELCIKTVINENVLAAALLYLVMHCSGLYKWYCFRFKILMEEIWAEL